MDTVSITRSTSCSSSCPLLTTAMTAFYMFRLWFLTFASKPRDHRVHEQAHESPAVMTVPLIVLAIFSLGVAWGWPVWDANSSYLGGVLAKSRPSPSISDSTTSGISRTSTTSSRADWPWVAGFVARGRLLVLDRTPALERGALRDGFAGLPFPRQQVVLR